MCRLWKLAAFHYWWQHGKRATTEAPACLRVQLVAEYSLFTLWNPLQGFSRPYCMQYYRLLTSYCRPSVRLFFCLWLNDTYHNKKKKWIGSASQEYNFTTFNPLTPTRPLKLPPFEPYILVPSGEYIKYTVNKWTAQISTSGIGVVNNLHGSSRQRCTIGCFSATAGLLVNV